MSWISTLCETYEHIDEKYGSRDGTILWPISHFVKNAHIEVVLDVDGVFLRGRAKLLNGDESPTLIPATEASAGRSGSKIAPHPLCEELGYCAFDLPNLKKEKNSAYVNQLNDWASSSPTQKKLNAIAKYIDQGTLWSDLSAEFEFPLKIATPAGTSQSVAAEKAFVRWRVEEHGNPNTGTWEDDDLIYSWIDYDKRHNSKEGICYVLGEKSRIAFNHPRFVRRPGDGAKLISSNDMSGFTFKGRFTDTGKSIESVGYQPVNVGFEVTQKAHGALRWLISRQGSRNGDITESCV